MPELPEVETIVRQLAPILPGRSIRQVDITRPDLLREDPAEFRRGLEGLEIQGVNRRGKNIVLSLSGSQFLVVNLGMTGKLLFFPPSPALELPSHLALDFSLEPAGRLFYVDVRRFGHLIRYSGKEWEAESTRFGPEPLGVELAPPGFHESLSRSRAPIRSWLLDQTRLAGVGNIYASEALFRAKIHPQRRAKTLDPSESGTLLDAIREVLQEAIQARGTTLRDYRTATGELGDFGPSLRAYGREGSPCPTCGEAIQRIVFANRSAFLCPACQPETPSPVA